MSQPSMKIAGPDEMHPALRCRCWSEPAQPGQTLGAGLGRTCPQCGHCLESIRRGMGLF